MSDMVKRLKRNPERWAAMNMTAVMEGSPAQALFALEDAKADIATLAAELSRLSALVAELTKTGQIASRTPLDILGDQRIGVGVGQDGPYVTGPSSLSQLKDTTNADK